ncbi:rCG61297 [Rattus norvegicus]|uniref:RCG61297 n=1 Tax=Rattus norvegicus TaxID=10116 RepID=A6KE09_RAT|nr:rCG61297 [Rattus norvegicus]
MKRAKNFVQYTSAATSLWGQPLVSNRNTCREKVFLEF